MAISDNAPNGYIFEVDMGLSVGTSRFSQFVFTLP